MLPVSSLLLRSALRTGLTPSSTQQWRRAYAGVVDLKSDEEFKKKLADYSDKNQLAIVDFTAKWCGPCKVIAPHFEQLSKQHPEVKFLKVDIDDPHLNQTVMDHGITGVPTFAVYRGSKRLESFTGARLDYLKECIAKHGAASK